MALLEFLATATGAWVITTDVAQGITRGFDGVMMSVIVTAVGTMHVSPDLPVVVIVITVRSMDVFGFGFFFLHAG